MRKVELDTSKRKGPSSRLGAKRNGTEIVRFMFGMMRVGNKRIMEGRARDLRMSDKILLTRPYAVDIQARTNKCMPLLLILGYSGV